MTTTRDDETGSLVIETLLPARLETVWKALNIAEFREAWLPLGDLADPHPVASVWAEEISYRMRDREPPFRESLVTFRLRPEAAGTRLTITHAPPAEIGRSLRDLLPANGNGPLMLAA